MIKYSERPVIHTRLYKAMEEQDYNCKTLALSSGVAVRTIYAIIYGDILYPRLDTVIMLARTLGKSLDYFYPITETEQIKTPV